MGGIGGGDAFPDGIFGLAVGGRDRIEQIASFMVNSLICPEMRQYDRTGPVGKLVSGGEQRPEFKLFGIGHGESLEAILL